ncbi:MAG: TonB-dependent receptor [Lewinellaceae bacterium]|nr:TonB-dependent receptor [Lewinellaceae bacterium]
MQQPLPNNSLHPTNPIIHSPPDTCNTLNFVLTLFFLLFFHTVFAQGPAAKFTVSGYVSDAASGERLIGATVVDRRSGQGTVSNTYGFYSITLPADSVALYVAYIGYEAQTIPLMLHANRSINVNMEASAVLKEVEIVADKYERIEERAQMGRIDVPIAQIKQIPALLGEKDVLKALQLLPGVSGGGEGQSGLYVRGGGPDQNLILLDGVPVYNASHLFGFFSVFNADAIRDVSLTKGGFPARFGGRLSSVVEINMKEGNENEFHGEGSVGIVASKLTLEGPITKGKSSFIVSGRRTYIDLLARPLIKSGFKSDGSEGVAGYYFYDLNAKVNHRFSDKDRLFFSFYTGKDKFYLDLKDRYNYAQARNEYDTETGLGWGNLTAALRWNHVLSPRLFANATLTYSRYKFNTDAASSDRSIENGVTISESAYSLGYFSGIDDVAAKVDFDFLPNPQHYIKFGGSAIVHTFYPGRFDTYIKESVEDPGTSASIGQPNVTAGELALYAEDDWKATDRLRLNYGIHISSFLVKGNPYLSVQPRLNMRYLLNKGWALKGAFSTMRQYIHLLTNETIGLPTDLWLPTTAVVKPQDSWQAALGLAKTIGKDYEFSAEAYYKEMKNVIAFREGASLFQFDDWQSRVEQGDGTAYGLELFVQKKKGRFNGWVGYTLSWAWREFDNINLGRRYPYKFDRRHDFEIVGSYKFNDRVSLSATWVYSTGNAVTLGTSKYQAPGPYTSDGYYYSYETTHTAERNNFRYQSYHRLDVGVDFTKQKKRHQRTWSFGAYNAYNRKNPFFLLLDKDYDNQTGKQTSVLKQVSLFPVIPYVAYSFKF